MGSLFKNKEALLEERQKLLKDSERVNESLLQINRKIRDIESKERLEYLKELNITEGSYLIGFAKHPDYHYVMIQGIQVVDITNTANAIECVTFKYRVDDGDLSLSFLKERFFTTQIGSIREDFRIYSVTATQYMDLLKQLTVLSVNMENVDKYEEVIKGEEI